MTDVDQIAAVRATLELLTADNDALLVHFKELNKMLGVIEKMPPSLRRTQFRQLEQSGAFKYNNADIRHFANSTKHLLTPPQFVQRTMRRLYNTGTLIDVFLEHQDFVGGKELQRLLQQLTTAIVDVSDDEAVIAFKYKVETLRETPLFKSYLDIKDRFLKGSPELKDEADFLAAKEAVTDGEMMAESLGKKLQEVKESVESGAITPEEAQQKIEDMEIEEPS